MNYASDPMNRPFSVMSINLRFGLADDGDNAWEHRRKAYGPLFTATCPDFIGMQEANNFQTRYLAQLLRDYRFVGVRNPSPSTWQNNLIFYRKEWTCLRHTHCFLSDTPHEVSQLEGSRWPRQCVIGEFEREEERVVCVTTHFDFDEKVQAQSADLLMGFLEDFPGDVPMVITGDFNAPPESLAHAAFQSGGFKDSFAGEHSSTFHGFTGNDLGKHIDWILYKGKLKVMDAKVIKHPFEGIYPSDHYPVVCRFT
ncbi:endonuclease/exonuclease/phosphatase family protein [Desulfoluna spongiiphila]|uniref:Metal-dependent hydrolase, endonuclease/exonuclease/phosphatase family n=1 Tax=Desulfoluna spongiiphila TaxID=419481 RepID=A0A1G5AFL7_9BACT|nr:endonuclease/exonuclease/phosphatase family protein [Desulfoluna spongiiphila]SCX76676.1 Metal-dependent hydrolase, endonuclease/exonuclease/phosphatase family [Desulfoluna spongiiphila]VVS90630.1 endonuclease/exonuclease/phosphatase [Desulfoluna spongiiphila]